MIDIREYFLEAIAEAKSPAIERKVILRSCAIPYNWFNGKRPTKAGLEQQIMSMSEEELKLHLALFLADCYCQR